MNNKHINIIWKAIFLVLVMSFSACVNDLDIDPVDPDQKAAEQVYEDEDAFLSGLMKIYAGFAVSGQEGPAGNGDLEGFDEGNSQYWRGFFVCQELPTDEAVNGWNDGNLPRMSQVTWTSANEFIRSFYYRALYQVSVANEYLRQANNVVQEDWENADTYIAEARFLRAFAYWHALDLFGNRIPFTTEETAIGGDLPLPAGEDERGPELFNYLESELLDIVGDGNAESPQLGDPRTLQIGRADKAAGWMLLAKLYLNHAVYLGSENATMYESARTYLDKVIDEGGFSLITTAAAGDVYHPYEFLFLADNYRSNDEIIFSINFDGLNSQSFGGTTYIVNASIGGSMIPSDYGTNSGWGGNRTTSALVEKFSAGDARALFYTDGQTLEIQQQDQFTQGYAVIKFKNKTREGVAGGGGNQGFSDVNAPVFRLADAYLMAAEVDLRLGEAVSGAHLDYLNEIRDRAGVAPVSNVDLQFILDERARELYWECHRRTDLIRFGQFVSGYDWPLKGGVLEGSDVPERYDLMPIPTTDITANPRLIQNPGY
ncbi:RagB/SusD family nutrient uptake outer membrane protein [Limibacter armeniacum]|uniref:RagB/SusD family nutrient uptake outer membrane protein n=1 Tax=Limibacter armeniacum TaxID=466084 RepID=UPI002FE5D00A